MEQDCSNGSYLRLRATQKALQLPFFFFLFYLVAAFGQTARNSEISQLEVDSRNIQGQNKEIELKSKKKSVEIEKVFKKRN